jgi:mono/diheme cytochrome c family protein
MSRTVIVILILTAMVLGLLPFAFVARSRASKSENLPVHLVMDMDKQSKYKAQRESAMFADGRAMRPAIEGTVAQEDMVVASETLNDPANPRPMNGGRVVVLSDPSVFAAVMLGRVRAAGMSDADFDAAKPVNVKNTGATDADIAKDTFYVKTIPAEFPVTADFMKRGQERFNIYCLPCHGASGYGDGPVALRAKGLQDAGTDPTAVSGWVKPQDLNEAKILARPDGHIFNTITNGVRSMPAYDKQISVSDRWAIIGYLRAVERSQHAQPDDLTADERAKLPL